MIRMHGLVKLLLGQLFLLVANAAFNVVSAQPFAYVTGGTGNLAIINTATNTVVANVVTGADPIGVSVNPAGTRVYAVNYTPGSVSVIDTANASVITTITVGATPVGVAFNPAGTRAYVANRDGTASVIDTASNTVIATVPMGLDPHGVAVNPAGTRAFVTNFAGANVSVMDTSTNTVIATVPVNFQPFGVVFNSAGTFAYVGNLGASNISVIDTSNNTVVATIPVGLGPFGVAINTAGTRVYVANSAGNTVSVIDTSTNTVVATVPVGTQPYGIAVNPAGTFAYAANSGSNSVSVINTSSNTVVATVPLGFFPQSFGQFVGGPAAMVPGAPTIGTATTGVVSATVTYTPPAFNGGSPITAFTAISNPAGISGTVTSGPIIVNGLTPGTPYTFTVYATNAVGNGPASAASSAATPTAPPALVVTNTSDSGAGSLRDAITNANAFGCISPATINFNITGAGPFVISPTTDLPPIACPMLIDGYSQTGAVANTFANGVSGSNAVIKIVLDGLTSNLTGNGLALTGASAGSTIRGLSIGGFLLSPAIHVGSGADSTNITGNFLGVGPGGATTPNKNGVEVFAAAVQVGGAVPAARNVISCNTGDGIELTGSADIRNNDIGTKPDGSTACGNSGGINFKGATGGSVGSVGSGNFIRNNLGHGIFLDSTDFIPIQDNVINGNSGNGIAFGTRSDCAGSGNNFKRNSIGTQGGLGIALDSSSARGANDALDVDGGGCDSFGNNGQNYPTVDLVTYRPDKTLLDFTLSSEASKIYDIEIFSNVTPDAGNKGRGETSIATTSATTAGSGTVSTQNFIVSNTGPNAKNISMLATNQATGDSSEFSLPYITPATFAPLAGFAAYSITAGGTQTQIITLTNILGQPVTFAAPAIVPAANFTVTANTCATPVPFPGSCQITLQYSRATAGSDTAALEVLVPFNMANLPVGADTKYQFPLSGLAAAAGTPAVTVTGTTLFPNTLVSLASGVQPITITNSGTGPLTISSVTHSLPTAFPDTTGGPAPNVLHYCGFGSVAGGAPNTGTPIVIAAGASCVLNLIFTPTSPGSFNGTITVNSNAATSPTIINLSGTGVSPPATFSPAGLLFGNVPITVSVPQVVTFTNTSSVVYNILSVVDSAPGFFASVGSGATQCAAGLMLAAGASCTYTTTYTAAGTGTANNILTISFKPGASATTFTRVQTGSGTGFLMPATVAPVSFAFGNLAIGSTLTNSFTFTNNSNTTLYPTPYTLTSLSTTGLFFTGVGSGGVPCTVGLMLAPGASCGYTVTVTPTSTGASNATTSIGWLAGLGTNPPYTTAQGASVNGVAGSAPVISFTAAPASFVVGATSVGTLTITNPNAVPVTANGFTFNYLPGLVNAPVPNVTSTCVGAAPTATPGAAFSVQPTSFTLPASGSCTFSSAFTSAVASVYSGTIAAGLIVTAAGNSNATPFSVTVTAALSPAITFAPPSPINFGTRTVNTTSPNSLVTLTNSGSAPLVITGITSSGDFGFTTTCPISTPPIAALASCNINISFTPLTVAVLTGSLTIVSNAPGSPHVISLTGTGAAVAVAGITITPTTLNFGANVVGTNSTPQSVTVKNTGLATLNLTSISVSPPFIRVTPALPTPPDCLATLAPNATCQIAVIFTPTAVASVTGTITIVHNAGGSPALVALNGVGTPIPVAQIRAPASIDFGDQIIASSGTQTLTINNPGTATLNVSAIALGGTDAASYTTSGTCTSINAGASCAITITFTPTTVGAKTAQITITSNASSQSSMTVNLTGNGILAPRPIVELSVTAIGFGNNIFGGATANQNVTLRNGGGVALAIQSIASVGDFVLANGCPASLASTASCVISIQFSPLGQGGRSGELTINTNAQGSPHRIPLSGTGCRWFSQVSSRFFLTSCSG